MSFAAALESGIFRTYLAIIAGAVGAAGLLLAVMTWGFKRNVRSVWINYRSWLVMIALGFIFVVAGRAATIAGITLVSLAAFKQFARATGVYRDWWMSGGVYLGILAVAALALVKDPATGHYGWYGLFMAMPVYAIVLLLMIPILRNRAKGQVQVLSLAIVGFLYFGWMFGHLGLLADSNNPYGYLIYLLFAVSINDIAAFTFGKLLGRHKLRSEISPNKTWEGAIGALAVSMALPWLLWFSFPHFGPPHLLLTGLIVGVGGQLGDLSISFFKRDIGIKDMGMTIPGHGGIPDRIDSLIFTAPLFLHMVRWFHGLN